MATRLRDFAELHRISERAVQKHIKDNFEELAEHIDRRGKMGTWLDDYACEFLLQRIQLPTKDDVVVPTPREAALMAEIIEANKRLADAERRAGINAEAAGKVQLLEASAASQSAQIADLSIQLGQAQERAQAAASELVAAQQRIAELEGRRWYHLLFKKKE